MPTYKYFTFPVSLISEIVAGILCPFLAEHKIWYTKLYQNRQYRGLKVGLDKKDFNLFKKLANQARESSKTLKMNTKNPQCPQKTTVLTQKEELNMLFPVE